MSWEDEDQREDWEWSQPWEDAPWPEASAGPEYAMAAWCLVMLDGDFYAPRARWTSDR